MLDLQVCASITKSSSLKARIKMFILEKRRTFRRQHSCSGNSFKSVVNAKGSVARVVDKVYKISREL